MFHTYKSTYDRNLEKKREQVFSNSLQKYFLIENSGQSRIIERSELVRIYPPMSKPHLLRRLSTEAVA
ncbi:MAG: hypothetical protein H8E14_14895 [Candidatus Marinimicrobia bacterium]|nr:hypothetical protein [Candidatus Neomarinimicrobiota bacterium]